VIICDKIKKISDGLMKKETTMISQNSGASIQSIPTIMVGKDTTSNLSCPKKTEMTWKEKGIIIRSNQ
jgi:hypothetical protein